jgi:glycosyltransferase involved in cell wall biosynthesis
MADFADFVNQLNSVINSTADKTVVGVGSGTVAVDAPAKPLDNTIVTPAVTDAKVSKKLKIMIVTTHINQVNGYSKVVHNILQQLSQHPWIEATLFGTQKMTNADLGRKTPPGVRVIDGSAMEKQKKLGFAFSELPGVILAEKPDVVLIYNDLSVICGYIEELRKAIQSRFFRLWAYLDITYQAPPQHMIDIINRDVERIFCFTKSWKEALKAQGITRPVDVMNHGFDSKLIRPIPRELARQTLGLPKDIFLFTSLNKNIPRKRLDLLIMSFVRLIVKFPMKPIFMLIVSDKGDRGGYPLFEIFAREIKLLGASIDMFGNRLLITANATCYKDEDINLLNNCGNVGVSCAEGEGFGLCSFEQMAVGVPQIVPEINGYTEYCTPDNSTLVKPHSRYYVPMVQNIVTGEAQAVDPSDVAKAMEQYVFNEDLCKLHGKLAKETVAEYTWEKCCAPLIKRLLAVRDDDE